MFFTSTCAIAFVIRNVWLWQNRTARQNGLEAIWMGRVPQSTAKLRQDKLSLHIL